jgi:hypothetical protein
MRVATEEIRHRVKFDHVMVNENLAVAAEVVSSVRRCRDGPSWRTGSTPLTSQFDDRLLDSDARLTLPEAAAPQMSRRSGHVT